MFVFLGASSIGHLPHLRAKAKTSPSFKLFAWILFMYHIYQVNDELFFDWDRDGMDVDKLGTRMVRIIAFKG